MGKGYLAACCKPAIGGGAYSLKKGNENGGLLHRAIIALGACFLHLGKGDFINAGASCKTELNHAEVSECGEDRLAFVFRAWILSVISISFSV